MPHRRAGSGPWSRTSLPDRPRTARSTGAEAEDMAWSGARRGSAAERRVHWAVPVQRGAVPIELGSLILVNVALWGFFAWSAMQFDERKHTPPSVVAPQ